MTKNNKKIELVKDSQVFFSLFRLPYQSAEEIIEPADELVHYLEKSLKIKVPQYDKAYPVRLNMLINPLAELEDEEFIIECSESHITLEAATLTSMFHAVYFFLEKALGIRWFWPGEDGEVVPELRELSFPCGTIREKPDFKWRAIQTKGAIYGDADGIDWSTARHAIMKLPLSQQKEFELWARRNRMGGLKVSDGHRWSEIVPTEIYGEKNPEFYALKDNKRDNVFYNGKHNNQPCLSNEEIVEIMADYACSRFKRDPDLDICSIAFNDGPSECECRECQEMSYEPRQADNLQEATNELSQTGRSVQNCSITDLVYKNANETAEAVVKKFPNKKLLTLLYSNSRFAPEKYSLSDKVVGQFCIMGNSLWNKKLLREETKLLADIAEKTPELGIYEYYSNGKWPEIYRLFPGLVEKTLNIYYDNGARYFSTQPGMGFATNGINFYVLAKTLWNRKENSDKLLDEYCEKGFGPACEDVKNFLSAFAERWKETESATKIPGKHVEARLALAELYSDDFLKQREIELESALSKANDHEYAKRINFLRKGLTYTSLYCAAIRASAKVYSKIADEKLNSVEFPWDAIKYFPQADKCILEDALEAWNKYWEFVKQNMGKFIFGDYWVNYRPGILGAKDLTINAIKQRLKTK